jgi:hypothetical protein
LKSKPIKEAEVRIKAELKASEATMKDAEDRINREAAASEARLKEIDRSSNAAAQKVQEIGDLARTAEVQTNKLVGQVKGLSARVDRIEGPSEKLALDSTFPSGALATTLQDFLGFQRYLREQPDRLSNG